MRERCTLSEAAEAKLTKMMNLHLGKIARYHGLTREQMECLAYNLIDEDAFTACMLVLRPNIKNKFLKDIRAKVLDRIQVYIKETSVDDPPAYPSPLSFKQIETIIDRFESDVFRYINLYHMCQWTSSLDIVEPLESVLRGGAHIRDRNWDNWKYNKG